MVLILDIRSRQEYCSGHICGAYNIPTPLPPKRISVQYVNNIKQRLFHLDINEKEQIVVYCKKGIRSTMAADALKSMGFTNIYNWVV